MNSLAEALNEINDVKASDRLDQYKNKGLSSQVKRRVQFLEALKEKRFNYVLHARNLAEGDYSKNDDEDDDDKDVEDGMEWTEARAAMPRKLPRAFKNQLMLSEWLLEKPSDLETEWLMVLCPAGKRCLVVASKGETKAYARNGWRINSFPSWIPGGHRSCRASYSILDCIYDKLNKTIYILDIMCWKNHPIYDSETEFRFYWLQEKLAEVPEAQKQTDHNPFKFVPLRHYNCDRDTMQLAMNEPFQFNKLDGVLFYHKRTHYIAGACPLVGWLKAFMMPEMLNVNVPDSLCGDKPVNYRNMHDFLNKEKMDI